MSIQAIGTNSVLNNVSLQQNVDKTSQDKSFSNVISDAINKVNEAEINADSKVEALINGDEDITMHEVMLSMEESQLSMQLLIEVRNKVVEAYQEINRVQL